MTRIRNGLGLGTSHSEARNWHKKVYSGLVRLLPESATSTSDAAPHPLPSTPERACGLLDMLTMTRPSLQMPLTQLLPEDIGAAAAYEAYRTWKYNSFLHEPLSAERDAQREGLIGMAVAESWSTSSYFPTGH